MALEAVGTGDGTGHGAIDLALDLGQLVNEEIGGGAGADTDDRAGFDILDRGLGNGLLHFVLGHEVLLFFLKNKLCVPKSWLLV